MHRENVRHWRYHRRTLTKIARKNQHNYRLALRGKKEWLFLTMIYGS